MGNKTTEKERRRINVDEHIYTDSHIYHLRGWKESQKDILNLNSNRTKRVLCRGDKKDTDYPCSYHSVQPKNPFASYTLRIMFRCSRRFRCLPSPSFVVTCLKFNITSRVLSRWLTCPSRPWFYGDSTVRNNTGVTSQ